MQVVSGISSLHRSGRPLPALLKWRPAWIFEVDALVAPRLVKVHKLVRAEVGQLVRVEVARSCVAFARDASGHLLASIGNVGHRLHRRDF